MNTIPHHHELATQKQQQWRDGLAAGGQDIDLSEDLQTDCSADRPGL
jgi:hypothetical protein